MLAQMVNIASECIKTPGHESVWAPRLGKFVCRDTPDGHLAILDQASAIPSSQTGPPPPISPKFKLVFLTAAGGTILFVILCLVLSMIAGREAPPLFEKVIMGFFDLAKIGFGAVVGLLGGKTLQSAEG